MHVFSDEITTVNVEIQLSEAEVYPLLRLLAKAYESGIAYSDLSVCLRLEKKLSAALGVVEGGE